MWASLRMSVGTLIHFSLHTAMVGSLIFSTPNSVFIQKGKRLLTMADSQILMHLRPI
uniref:Uncharacterized protein n=1 Tax=Macaca fascicularis TaxID=9541 RepID=A0A7N9CAU7_MACFA